jgi:hypothetical protein
MSEKRTQSDKAQRQADHLEEKAFRRPADLPRLIADGNLERCSVCGYPFPADIKPSMSVAFADHLRKAHKPGQTTEDVNQAAARVVREATENK